MTVNGHIMGDQIALVYVTLQWFDESMLCSFTHRLATHVVLQFDVLPAHRSSAPYCARFES